MPNTLQLTPRMFRKFPPRLPVTVLSGFLGAGKQRSFNMCCTTGKIFV